MLRFDSPVWPPSKSGKQLKGKYLQLLENFVGSLKLDPDDFLLEENAQHDELVKGLVGIFGEHLSEEDVEMIIFRQCMYFEINFQGRKGSLAEPENRDLFDSLVGRIKSFFESIPRHCIVRIGLPSMDVQPGLSALAPDIRLVGSAPIESNKLLRPQPQRAYLEIEVHGYGDGSASSPAASAALSIAKQFAFAMQVFGIRSQKYGDLVSETMFRESEGAIFFPLGIPEGIRNAFGRMAFNESKILFYDWMNSSDLPVGIFYLEQIGRKPKDATEALKAQEYALRELRRFFKARANEDFEQIAAAIEWYQDSMWADNDTFAYIAACIGLEAVLGSSDEQLDSLSKRLADRYAFLMGHGRKEREELRTAYGQVLRLRGRLVHGKAARLDPKERPLLKKVQDLLLQLLWREILRIRPAS